MSDRETSCRGNHVKHPDGRFLRTVRRAPVPIALLFACAPSLPEHELVSVTPLTPRRGSRVEIRAAARLTQDECRALIDAYREKGAPDGQVSVRQPLGSDFAPYCVENFDDRGVTFNDALWDDGALAPAASP